MESSLMDELNEVIIHFFFKSQCLILCYESLLSTVDNLSRSTPAWGRTTLYTMIKEFHSRGYCSGCLEIAGLSHIFQTLLCVASLVYNFSFQKTIQPLLTSLAGDVSIESHHLAGEFGF